MLRNVQKPVSTAMATVLLCSGLIGMGALTTPAMAACSGENSFKVLAADPMNGSSVNEVKVDSCKAQKMIDGFANVKDAAGLAGLLGSGFWPTGVTGGVIFAWAWGHQAAIKDCAKGNKGIKFKENNGLVSGCSSQ